MSWNYRIMVQELGYTNIVSIHEVYYDEDGNVTGWTENPIPVTTSMENGESTSLDTMWEMMAEAFKKPHLNYSDGKELP